MGLLTSMLARPSEKAVLGPGAVSMTYDTAVLNEVGQDKRRFLKEAQAVYHRGNRWIRRAEMTISQRVGAVGWHLANDGEEVDDELEGVGPEKLQLLLYVRDLLEKPTGGVRIGNQPMTRREQWQLTSRHAGLCNIAFWYLDEINALTKLPKRILYIRPDRMTPAKNKQTGELTGWILDYKDTEGSGTPIGLDEVLTFYLDPPDEGFYGSGLVETAMSATQIAKMVDRHATNVLASGGRLAGMFSPKEAVTDETVYKRLVSDLRSITDMPDAAKRSIVARAPVDFVPTAADPAKLNLVEIAKWAREDIASLWGVPLSLMGIQGPAGLQSGENRKYDEAALWQGAVEGRIASMEEVIQYQLLDRLDPLGIDPQLVIERPTFDDDTPLYDQAQKAADQPLTQRERRAILGLDPFGDDRDDEVWLGGRRIYPPEPIVVTPILPPPPPRSEKARITDDEIVPRLRRAMRRFLDDQREEVADRITRFGPQISRKPGDVTVWWDARKWDDQLQQVLAPFAETLANHAATQAAATVKPSGKADFTDLAGRAVFQRLLGSIGRRIKGINDTTRTEIADLVRTGIGEGVGPAELGTRIREATTFADHRAEAIARTEAATVFNEAAVESYREFNVQLVEVIDGDGDEVCASANGKRWTLDEANDNPIGHPNCTRDFVPVIA